MAIIWVSFFILCVYGMLKASLALKESIPIVISFFGIVAFMIVFPVAVNTFQKKVIDNDE